VTCTRVCVTRCINTRIRRAVSLSAVVRFVRDEHRIYRRFPTFAAGTFWQRTETPKLDDIVNNDIVTGSKIPRISRTRDLVAGPSRPVCTVEFAAGHADPERQAFADRGRVVVSGYGFGRLRTRVRYKNRKYPPVGRSVGRSVTAC